jgi:hypothetical protein
MIGAARTRTQEASRVGFASGIARMRRRREAQFARII